MRAAQGGAGRASALGEGGKNFAFSPLFCPLCGRGEVSREGEGDGGRGKVPGRRSDASGNSEEGVPTTAGERRIP